MAQPMVQECVHALSLLNFQPHEIREVTCVASPSRVQCLGFPPSFRKYCASSTMLGTDEQNVLVL